MKPSRYSVFVEGPTSVYAVNLMSRAALELSPEAYGVYRRLVGEDAASPDDAPSAQAELDALTSTLVNSMFVLDDHFDELAYIRYRTNQARFDTRQLGVVIAPTMGCNFGCHYCFEQKIETTMRAEAQDRLVALIAANLVGREHLSVQWFGGEPLQAMDVVESTSEKLMRLAAAAGTSYAATVITNGFLMTDPVSVRLAAAGVQTAQISLDGDRPLHDRTRHEAGSTGSFDVILDNIRRASARLAIKLRVHVSPGSIQSVQDLIDTLADEGMAPHVAELYFAPLFNYRAGQSAGRAYLPDGRRFMGAQEFSAIQIELLTRAADRGFKNPDFLEASYGICTAVRGNTLVVDADGHLLKCYKDVGQEAESMGTLESGALAGPNLLKWMDVQVPRDDDCRDCRVLPVCLGGCSKQ